MNIEFTYLEKDLKDLLTVAKNNPYFCKNLKSQFLSIKRILILCMLVIFSMLAMGLFYSKIKNYSFHDIAIIWSIIILYGFSFHFLSYLFLKNNIFSVYSKRLYKLYKYADKLSEHIELKKDYLIYKKDNNSTLKIYYKDLKEVYNEKDIILAYWWKDVYVLIPKRVLKSQKEIDKVLSLLQSGKN